MSMQLQNIIDKEELDINSHRLAEFHHSNELKSKIDKVRDRFIEENTVDDEIYWVVNFNKTQLIYKFAEEIKSMIGGVI